MSDDNDTFDALLREAVRAPERDPPRKKLEPGERIDRYVIESLLGEGGMGTVYRARDEKLRRRVALKILHAGNADASRRLLREARAAAALDHPNAVSVFDVGEHDGALFIAMELVKGRSLRARAPPALDLRVRARTVPRPHLCPRIASLLRNRLRSGRPRASSLLDAESVEWNDGVRDKRPGTTLDRPNLGRAEL